MSSAINNAFEALATRMRLVPGLLVYVQSEPALEDPPAPSVTLDPASIEMELQDLTNRVLARISADWILRTAPEVGEDLIAALQLLEDLLNVLGPDSAGIDGPQCQTLVSASTGGDREPGSNYVETRLTTAFAVYVERT